MASPPSTIVTQDFATVEKSGVISYVQDQKKLAITLIVVGTILALGSVVALVYTSNLNPAVPVSFGVLLGSGIVIAASPARKDWKPYHTRGYFDYVRRRFQKIDDGDFDGLKRLFRDFRFDKLQRFAYIGPGVARIYTECAQDFQAKTLDKNRAALNKWNAQFQSQPQ